jgi:hypothetical protein
MYMYLAPKRTKIDPIRYKRGQLSDQFRPKAHLFCLAHLNISGSTGLGASEKADWGSKLVQNQFQKSFFGSGFGRAN